MIHWLYDLGFLVFAVFSLPHFLARLRQAEDARRLLRERFGYFTPDFFKKLNGRRPLWIHSVSVGEVLAVEKLVQILLGRVSDLQIVLTTVTPTGQQLAKKWEGERLKVLYFPFDFKASVRRFFETLNPAALLLVETEIWPHVIQEARCRQVPIGIINGRLSERSLRAFRRFSVIFQPLLRSIDFFLLQTEKDRERFLALGIDPDKVQVTGNMKLDLMESDGPRKADSASLRQQWGFLPSDQILIGGSTHAGEEEILLRVLRRLRDEQFPLKMLLAPRHIERASQVLELVKNHHWEPVLATQLAGVSSFDVLILNRLGVLRELYAMADVVVMGGSFVPHGGQNPAEPARFARPILHGRWVFNFEEIYQRLEEEGGSLRVQGEEELFSILRRILASEQERAHLGNRAYEVLESLRGATERNFQWIQQRIPLGVIENEKLHNR